MRQIILIDGPRVLSREPAMGAQLGLTMMMQRLELLIQSGVIYPLPTAEMSCLLFGAVERAGLSVAEGEFSTTKAREDLKNGFDVLVGAMLKRERTAHVD